MLDFEFEEGKLTKVNVKEQHILFQDAKFLNQYGIEISRVAPSFDNSKAIDISKMVKRVSIVHDHLAPEEIQIGSAYLNLLLNRQVGELSVSFIEDKKANVHKFLKMHGGEDIIPTNGTYLLPYEYYFNIKIIHYKDGVNLLSDDYILTANFSHEYQAGEAEFQQIEATFCKIKSWK